MADTTIAEQRWALIAPDRARHMTEMQKAATPWPGMTARLAAITNSDETFGAHVVQAMAAAVLKLVIEAVTDGGANWKRDPNLLTVGATRDHDALASVSMYQDGSGLVQISDALVALSRSLACIAAWWWDPSRSGVRGKLKLFRGVRSPSAASGDRAVQAATAVLRYGFIHQRYWGVSAGLGIGLPEAAEEYVDVLNLARSCFVVGHEVGHFVLGHDAEIHSAKERHEIEYAADQVALAATISVLGRSGVDSRPFALLGSLLGLLALAASEKALFIRRPVTHPTPEERWQGLLHEHPLPISPHLAQLLTGLTTALGTAGEVTSSLPDAFWQAMRESPEISLEGHDAAYYQAIASLDEAAGYDLDRHFGFLESVRDEDGVDVATSIIRAPREGAMTALRALQVPEPRITSIGDRSRGLSHYSLLDTVWALPALEALSGTKRLYVANSSALLLREYVPGMG